jgi:hypothetical protein
MEQPPIKTVQPRAYMGMTWHIMWQSLVLSYQPVVRGSCDSRTAGMFVEAAMAELLGGVGTVVIVGIHKAQEGASGCVRCSH